MSKIITDTEIGKMIATVIKNRKTHVPDAVAYSTFLTSLAEALTSVCGGTVGCAAYDPGDDLGFTVGFSIDDRVPADGGVYAKYDTDVTWRDGKETQI